MNFFDPSSVSLKLRMYPSSFKMRASSFFSREAGTSPLGWRAMRALRTRVNMSAIGSDVIYRASLPARLGYAWDFAGEREFPETDPAEREFAQKSARASAVFAAITQPAFEFRCLLF